MKQLLSFALSLFLTSCSTLMRVPDAPDISPTEAEAAWGRVLTKNVDAEGRVNFAAIGKAPQDLEKFVHYVSKVKPESLTNDQAKLAFYLNAYNAISMFGVIQAEYPTDFDGFFKRLGFFYLRHYIIMGQEMSLYAFEGDYVRKMGDPRVHVALNCMSTSCPRLPREPFTEKHLDQQLEREALKFYNEDRNVRVDLKEKKVYLSEILDFFTKDFLAKSPTLIDYVNRYRKEKVPQGLDVKFIPYNWTVYKQPDKSQAK